MQSLHGAAPYAHWGLRLAVALAFLVHGIGKYPMAEFAAEVGLPVLLIWLVAIAEVIAAICLIVGAFGREMLTRLAGLIVIGVMIGAIATVHWPNGYSFANNGFEYQLLLLLTGLYFLLRGNEV